MITWKSKLFGDNRFNFYGWIGASLFVLGVTLWCVLEAARIGATHSPICLLLIAIYLVALGQLCLALQNYWARVAKNIETEDTRKNKKDETNVTQDSN